MNIKKLTLIATLSLFAANNMTASQPAIQSQEINRLATLLDFMPLIHDECNNHSLFPLNRVFACNRLNEINSEHVLRNLINQKKDIDDEQVISDINSIISSGEHCCHVREIIALKQFISAKQALRAATKLEIEKALEHLK